MTAAINSFQRLLDKYKFVNPVPVEVQSFALLNSRKNLLLILKNAGDYSFFFGRVLAILYLARKLNVRLTVVQSKLFFLLVSALLIAFTTMSLFFLVSTDKTPPHLSENIVTEKHVSVVRKNTSIKSASKQNPAIPENYIIGIDIFTGNAAAGDISERITSELKQLLGTKKVIMLGKGSAGKKPPKILMGSVKDMGVNRYLAVRLVNSTTSRIEYAGYIRISPEDKIDVICGSIAKDIVKKL